MRITPTSLALLSFLAIFSLLPSFADQQFPSPDQPQPLAAVPASRTRGLTEPWRVGIQAGHWKISELPDEQARLRADTGAQWKKLTEAEVNLPIATRVQKLLQAAGVTVDLLPATVPEGYDADAFVAIHADDGGGTAASGWKVATPWRSSEASRELRDAIEKSYSQASGLPEDRYGVSFNMRGYYGFSWMRFDHAIAVTTPAAIIETGFLTSATDRAIIVDDPDRAARGISQGILAYLAELAKLPLSALVPLVYPPMEVAAANSALRYYPETGERVRLRLKAGTPVRIVGEENGWKELIVWGNYRVFGWMKNDDLRPLTVTEEMLISPWQWQWAPHGPAAPSAPSAPPAAASPPANP